MGLMKRNLSLLWSRSWTSETNGGSVTFCVCGCLFHPDEPGPEGRQGCCSSLRMFDCRCICVTCNLGAACISDLMVGLGYSRAEINDSLTKMKYDDITATYLLLGYKSSEVRGYYGNGSFNQLARVSV